MREEKAVAQSRKELEQELEGAVSRLRDARRRAEGAEYAGMSLGITRRRREAVGKAEQEIEDIKNKLRKLKD